MICEFQCSPFSAGVAERSAMLPAKEGAVEIVDSPVDAWDMRMVSAGYNRRTVFFV
jgi:hypothetical protein